MKVNVYFVEEGNNQVGYVEGEIDTYTAPILRQELDAVEVVPNKKIILNLSKVNYLDSTGLGIFVAFYKRVTRENGQLAFAELTPRLLRLFEITGLSELMKIQIDETNEKVEFTNERF